MIVKDPIAGVYIKWAIRNDSANKAVSIWPMSGNLKITAPPPPLHATSSDAVPKSVDPACNCESLTPQEINGVYSEGNRTWRTVRASTAAGGQDYLVTNENWLSPELRIIMRHITDDPVEGLTTTDVTDVVRGDPAPALFTAPEGYEINDKRPRPISGS